MAGRYYEDLVVGQVIRHALRRTITEADNVLFCAITMNTQPLHLDETFAAQSRFGRRIVNGLLTMALAVGLSVPELTEGTLIANLGYDNVLHPHPMFHGDTLSVESEIVEKRDSRSQPGAGIVRFRHTGHNQDSTVVIQFERTALVMKQP